METLLIIAAAVALYGVISYFGLDRGIWENFRHDAVKILKSFGFGHEESHYVALTMFFVPGLWLIYLIHEMLFFREKSAYKILKEACEFWPYGGPAMIKFREEMTKVLKEEIEIEELKL
jgi:hypothetical protein